MSRPRFHLAFPVTDLPKTRAFYVDVLGASVGREADRWIDFDFWGHQISAHLVDESTLVSTNSVDGEQVPVRHFGVILERQEWTKLADRLRQLGCVFLIEPQIRFENEPGEQATFFLTDPSGNALEFKAFAEDRMVFSTAEDVA